MDLIKAVEADQVKEVGDFNIGDTVKVHFAIIEGKTERIQIYEGLVIAKKNSGLRKSFTVRKISYGTGVERIFPLNSPRIQKVELVRRGRVRRAKLYYMRGRSGKAARVAELIRRKSSKTEAPAMKEESPASAE